MIELDDISLKEGEDILKVMKTGMSAHDIHEFCGDRAAGLIADALDIMWMREEERKQDAK